MAERRMFAKSIVESDLFMDMPDSTKVLYFYLCMAADDDGFCDAPRKIMRTCGAKDDDMKLLGAKRFVIIFPEGVAVIRHWKIHNYIKKDRYKESNYMKMYRELYMDNNVYELAETDGIPLVSKMDPECIQNGSRMDTQVRLGKDRLELGKERLGNIDNNNTINFPYTVVVDNPTLRNIEDYVTDHRLNVDCERFFEYYSKLDWKYKGEPIDWKSKLEEWSNTEFPKKGAKKKTDDVEDTREAFARFDAFTRKIGLVNEDGSLNESWEI